MPTIDVVAVEVQWVRYGREAAEALRAAIASTKGGEPLAPVTVVVPSNHVGVAARRLLAGGSLGPVASRGAGLAAVTFLTPYRLAELLGAPSLAGTGRRPVSTPILAAAMRASLAERPGLFAPVAHHPATEAALVAAYRELRDLSPEALDRLAATGRRAADVVALHRAARSRLVGAWYDEEDLTLAAADTLRRGEGATAELGAVIVHLPQRLSRHGGALLAAAADARAVTVLAGTTGDGRADEEVRLSLARMGAPEVAAGPVDPAAVAAADRTRFLTASDADDEVRATVRAVVDAVRAGTPLDRIAILHAAPEPYGRLVHEQLAAAGIPANGAAVVPLAARMAGRALLQLLGLPAAGFRRQDVFAWLAAAPVLHEGTWTPVTRWERLSREAAVVGGRSDWDKLLAALADELDARATLAEEDPEAPPWRAERDRESSARARALRSFVLGLIDDLDDAAARPRRWSEHARWARRLLDRTLGGPTQRDGWPAAERKAAERVEVAIDRLASLDAVEPAVDLDVFIRTLELELEADLGRVGRFGDGVLVGSVAMGVGLDLDLVAVLGLAEGTFPAPVRDDSLLPDLEREAAGELPLRRHRVDRQHRELLATLAGAAHHVLGIPRGDLRRSSERVPSRWALDLASALAGERWWSTDLLRRRAPWIDHVASFDAGLRATAFPATEQEHRLRTMLAGGGPPDAGVAAGMAVVAARRSDRFTRFDGNLAGLELPSPAERIVSPTRMERWAACPFDYLLQDVLGVRPVENPEEELQITPMDAGSLVHRVLERFYLEVLERPPEERPAPDQPWSRADRERMRQLGEEVCDEFEAKGLTGRPIFWRRDRARILDDLQRFLRADDTRRALAGMRPLAVELGFGFGPEEVDAAPLTLPDGRIVRFRGLADRVDLGDDGTIHVVDYKTGGSKAFEALSEDDPDLRGRKLQLAVYGVAARLHQGRPDAPVRAEYWFVSRKGGFKRVGYPVTDGVLERVGRTLAMVVGGIERGVFPSHPTAVSTSPWIDCHACDPDALGAVELRRAWERKRNDPAVATYAALAEAEPDDDDG